MRCLAYRRGDQVFHLERDVNGASRLASQAAQRVLRHRVLYRGGELVNAVLR